MRYEKRLLSRLADYSYYSDEEEEGEEKGEERMAYQGSNHSVIQNTSILPTTTPSTSMNTTTKNYNSLVSLS